MVRRCDPGCGRRRRQPALQRQRRLGDADGRPEHRHARHPRGRPSWLGVAQAFTAAGGAAAGATSARLRLRFVAYPVRNNRARYRIEYDAVTNINTATGAINGINYSLRSGREQNGLDAVHRTTLVAPGEYPGSPIN